jgi:hypothetical protein
MDWKDHVNKVLAVALSGAVVLGFMLGVEPWTGSVPLCSVRLPNGVCVHLHEVSAGAANAEAAAKPKTAATLHF